MLLNFLILWLISIYFGTVWYLSLTLFWFFSVLCTTFSRSCWNCTFWEMYECCSGPTQLFLDAIASPSSYDGAITTQTSKFLFSESQWRSPFVVQISKTIWHSRFQNCNGGRPPSSSCFSLTTMQWTGALTSFGKFLLLFPPLLFCWTDESQ